MLDLPSQMRAPAPTESSILIAPSVLSADFTRLGDDVRDVDAAGATAIVAGSAIFGSKDYGAAIAAIRHSAVVGAARP